MRGGRKPERGFSRLVASTIIELRDEKTLLYITGNQRVVNGIENSFLPADQGTDSRPSSAARLLCHSNQ